MPLNPDFTYSIMLSLCALISAPDSLGVHPSTNHLIPCHIALHRYCVNNSLHAPESPLPVVLTCIRHVDIDVIRFLMNCILLLIPARCTHCTAAQWSLKGSTVITVSGLNGSQIQWFCPKHA